MKQPLTVGSLFSGIGGLDLGFERAGFKIRWMCEIDPFCRKVLRKHWPEVPIYENVRTLSGNEVEPIDVLIGGFPCQDISIAGKRVGINGARSGLWWEMFRVICEFRPRYVVIENVSGILAKGNLDTILGALAFIGYDAEWESLSACAFGASHMRHRVYIVAYPNRKCVRASGTSKTETRATDLHLNRTSEKGQMGNWWSIQPEPRSVVYGISGVVDTLRPFGNAVVPQVAEYVAHCILRHAEASP